MANSRTTKRYYVGPHDSIETVIDDQILELAYGDHVDVSLEVAKAMDESPEIWSKAAPETPAAVLWPPDKPPDDEPVSDSPKDGE
jgi:hypothetical protein